MGNETNKSAKVFVKWAAGMALVLILCIGIGTALLFAAAGIEQEKKRENVKASIEQIASEGLYPRVFPVSYATVLDNYTDGLMLNVAYTSSGELLRDALLGTNIWCKKTEAPGDALYFYFFQNIIESDFGIGTYGRYWHGYQVWLSPLLTFMTYDSIRGLNMAIQVGLLLLILALLVVKEKKVLLCIPFIVMWLCLAPTATINSMQFSSVFYMTFLTCIFLIAGHGRLSLPGTCLIFELCGIGVAYFDLLTYPVVSLGVPLILYFSLDYGKAFSFKQRFGQLFSCCASWGIGYSVMWASKWVLTSLLTGQDVIGDALKQAGMRMSDHYGVTQYSFVSVVNDNIAALICPTSIAAVVAAVLVLAGIVIFYRHRRVLPVSGAGAATLGVIGLICLYPFIWYLMLRNHSGIHFWMTYRNLAVSVYGLVSVLYLRFAC